MGNSLRQCKYDKVFCFLDVGRFRRNVLCFLHGFLKRSDIRNREKRLNFLSLRTLNLESKAVALALHFLHDTPRLTRRSRQ